MKNKFKILQIFGMYSQNPQNNNKKQQQLQILVISQKGDEMYYMTDNSYASNVN